MISGEDRLEFRALCAFPHLRDEKLDFAQRLALETINPLRQPEFLRAAEQQGKRITRRFRPLVTEHLHFAEFKFQLRLADHGRKSPPGERRESVMANGFERDHHSEAVS